MDSFQIKFKSDPWPICRVYRTLVSTAYCTIQNLLQLSLLYCEKHHVTLSAEKTKLQAFSNKATCDQAYYDSVISPVQINNENIDFVSETEHVGVIRAVSGNLPHILQRFISHSRALAAVLPVGLARGHRGNPAAVLRVHQLYAVPVLLSGVPTLVLKTSEISMIDQYLKTSVENLQKLMDRTPASVVAFLGGVLPGKALIHQRQLSIFGMITRSPGSLLHTHATRILMSAKSAAGSWFQQVHGLCIIYQLPHPLILLKESPTANTFNHLVKSKIIDYWEDKLREEASRLDSIPFFKPEFMSLTKPHPIWSSCGSNPFECHKAVTAARMLSGRYLTDRLQRHWTENKCGFCLLPACAPLQFDGTLEHLLLFCPSLKKTRDRLLELVSKVSTEDNQISFIINSVFCDPDPNVLMQFLLDCSTMPVVIDTTQRSGFQIRDRLLYVGRTWCYNIHRERMKQMGLMKFR